MMLDNNVSCVNKLIKIHINAELMSHNVTNVLVESLNFEIHGSGHSLIN